MPKVTVIMSASVTLTIQVEVDHRDQAYDAAKDVFYNVLNGGNLEHDVNFFELIDRNEDVELGEEEEEAREEMTARGWRMSTKEELDQGFFLFQHNDGVQANAQSWVDLVAQDPDTSID